MEKTLAMIKPDGVIGNYTDRIKNAILGSGFSILKETIVQLDEDSAASFYAEHSTKSFYSSLVKYITRYLFYFYDCCMLFLLSFFFFSPSQSWAHEIGSWVD
jgi:nucleoside diphosphate kinase